MFERRSIPLKRQTGAATLGDLSDVTITSAADGDFLQFDGAAWINTPNLVVENGNYLRVQDSTDVDYVQLSHDGTNATITTNAGNLQLNSSGGTVVIGESAEQLWLRSGSTMTIYSATNLANVSFAHDGSDLNVTGSAAAFFDLHGGMGLRIWDAFGTDNVSFDHDGTDLNQSYTTTTDHNFWGLTGAFKFKNAAQNDIFMVDFATSLVDIHDGYALRIRDSADTDYVDISHNGTDLLVTATNTAEIEISGCNLHLNGEALVVRNTGSQIYIYESDAADANDYYLLDANSGNFNHYFWDDSAASFKLGMRLDGVNQRVHMGGDTIGYFSAVTNNYGSVQVQGAEGSSGTWEGYSIGGRHVFMDNGSTSVGIYNDTDNEWLIQGSDNGAVNLYYNGATVARTAVAATNGGFEVNNTLTGGGFERVLTTSDLGGGGLDTKVKTATTGRSSTTTMADDPHLAGWTLTTGNKYAIIGHLTYIAANTTPDIKLGWQFSNTPADAGDWGLLQTDDAKVLQEADSESPITTVMAALDIASREQTAWIHGHFEANATTGGTVDLQWAQNTSSTTTTQLLLGSWIALIDLGA